MSLGLHTNDPYGGISSPQSWVRGSAQHPRRPSRGAGYAKVGAVYTCHRVYVSLQSVHSAPQPPVLPRTATFPKFLCDDRTGPTAPPCPPTPCLKIPHGAALPLVRVRCGQAAPPDGSTPEYLPVPRGGSGIKDRPIQRVGLPSLFLPMVFPQSWVLRFGGGRLVLLH